MKAQTTGKGMGLRHNPRDVSYGASTPAQRELARGTENGRRSKEFEIFQSEQLGTSYIPVPITNVPINHPRAFLNTDSRSSGPQALLLAHIHAAGP